MRKKATPQKHANKISTTTEHCKNKQEEFAERDETSCELDESIHPMEEIRTIEEKNEQYTTTVKINGIKKEIKIDTGSP